MKVIHISNYFAEFRGSFIDQIEMLGDKIKANGGECIYIFPNEAKVLFWAQELSLKHKVYFVSHINRWTYRKVIRELKELFNEEKPQVIHSHFDGYDEPIVKATNKSIKKVFHRHNVFDISNLPWYKKVYAAYCLNKKMNFLKFSGIQIFISESMKTQFIKSNFAVSNRSFVIFNGISIKKFKRNKKNENKTPIIFAFLGNWYLKGGDLLYDVLKDLNKENDNVTLASIFSNDVLDKIKNEYEGKIPSWIMPLKATNDIQNYYQMADLFISASRYETFSYGLAEAVYSGLPSISSDIEGVKWAKVLKSVHFFKSEDCKDLKTKIEYFLFNDKDDVLLKADQKIIYEEFSDVKWCENILELYQQI